MKLFITSILILLVFKINAKDFTYKSTGTLERNEVTTFPGGGKFISFKHSGGFETDIGKYGKYQCNGSILYDNNSSLEGKNSHFVSMLNTDDFSKSGFPLITLPVGETYSNGAISLNSGSV